MIADFSAPGARAICSEFARRLTPLFVLALVLCLTTRAVPAPSRLSYIIDPDFGSITFAVQHFGMFSSAGSFDRFNAELQIDPSQVESSRVHVTVDAASVSMAWADATAMLRSAEFFDAANYPTIRYTCTVVDTIGPGRYLIHGMLDMRGVKRPVELTATLIELLGDDPTMPRQAEFKVVGHLSRSAFGMVTNRWLISDTVDIRIRARIILASDARGG